MYVCKYIRMYIPGEKDEEPSEPDKLRPMGEHTSGNKGQGVSRVQIFILPLCQPLSAM